MNGIGDTPEHFVLHPFIHGENGWRIDGHQGCFGCCSSQTIDVKKTNNEIQHASSMANV